MTIRKLRPSSRCRHNSSRSNPLHRLAPVFGAAALAATATAQVTDPAIVESYGSNCGVTLSVSDSIAPNGDHALSFEAGGDPFQLAVMALGFDQAAIPLPSGCTVLTNPVSLTAGICDVNGDVSFPVTIPGWAQGSLYAQAATLDGAMNIETSRGLDLYFPGQSPTVDPVTSVEYPCYYVQTLNWNYPGDGVPTVNGRVRWPSSTCNSNDGPPYGRPIVIFMHGNGMDHQDHDYLMAHLARNGFVTCSIANGGHMSGTNEGRARQAISYLNAMHQFWGYSNRLSDDVVFMGHSRGGEAAITAARMLRDDPSLGHISYDVKAIVSIAPTDGGGSIADPKETITGDIAPSFLGLYGSRDPDVRGIRLEDPLNGPEETVFAIYDRAGTESSVEGLLLPASNVTKSLVYVDGATHRGFLDGCNLAEGGTIGCETHRDIARGYINAFLHWRVFNDSDYQAYFDGRGTPTSVRLEDVYPQTQFQKPGKRVVDNFEQGGLNTNTRGGQVTTNAGIAVAAENELYLMDPSAPHDTRGMRVKWQNSTGRVGWNIPSATVPFVGQARDVSNYGYISIRVAQDYLDAWNTPGQDQDFSLRFYSGAGWSNYVRLSDYGSITYPDAFITYPFPYPQGDYTKTAMTTIRVPLSAFSNFDPTDVWWVYAYFNVPGRSQGSVIIDSLEFAN
ncbi:MAG: hypothetical protein ACE37K_08720 [Planctomycetota bacterium]